MFRTTLLCLLSVVVLGTLGTWLILVIDRTVDVDEVHSREAIPSTAPPKRAGKNIDVAKRASRKRRSQSAPTDRTGILAEAKRYSTGDEELLIRDFFQDRNGGFFVDVGCALPIAGSNTYYLEKHLGWKGIGIDPVAAYEKAWLAKRPRTRFSSGRFSARAATTSGAQTTSLTDLLDRQRVAKIDLLSISGRVQALDVLPGFEIERFAPELVVVEGKKRAVFQWMRQHGYRLIKRYAPFDRGNRYFEPTPRSVAREKP